MNNEQAKAIQILRDALKEIQGYSAQVVIDRIADKALAATESATAAPIAAGAVPEGARPQYLLPDDMAALRRFAECCEDFDSGGHDVPKDRMARLCEIGVVEHKGFGRHQVTSFGDYVLGLWAGGNFKLPLKTLLEYNADAALAVKGN